MTIARKVIALFFCSGLLLCCIVTGYFAQNEYRVALDKLVERSLVSTLDRPNLQLAIYRRDSSALEQLLSTFLQPEAMSFAAAYSNLGELLAFRSAKGELPSAFPDLDEIRADASVTDNVLLAFDENREKTGTGLWSALAANEPVLHLTLPVFTPVNPTAKGLGPTEFTAAASRPNANTSLVVIGYIRLAIDSDVLIQGIRTTVGFIFASSLVLLLLCAIPGYWIAKNATLQLAQLRQLAGKIMAGEGVKTIDLDGSGEFKDIAEVLNGVIDGSATQKHELGLDHKLLLLQADESASQLSLREQELNNAAREISATREELHRLANFDRLTSLPNRDFFTEQLELLLRLCARNGKPLALLILDLDNFNRINESLGRSAGDLLLQLVGKRLEGCLRSSDMLSHYVSANDGLNISRLGNDEFAVVLSQLDSIESASLVAQRIVDNLVEPVTISDQELVITPSIGIALAPRHGMEAEALLEAANTARHHAKSNDSNRYMLYHEDMEPSGRDELKLESELRKAVERNQLSLHYQPQVNTTDGSITCAEALLRWTHPEFGQVSPARFIGMAEKIGLMWELGDWVLVEACRQMKAFRDEGLDLPRIAINISPQQFKPAFVTRLTEVLNSVGLPPDALELGLSEEILMDNDNKILKFLRELKETGVYLSLENFGTNHAPINYLSRHPLDEIKIDRSFVLDCDKSQDAARLVQAIIAMANSLELYTVAEGVETAGEFRFLAANGINIMRGYLFSKPVPPAELQQLLVVPWHYMAQLQRMALEADLPPTT